MNTLIQLDPRDIALALALIAAAIALSRLSGLGLEGKFAIAAGRTIVQLLAAGYIFAVVFSLDAGGILLAAMALISVAAIFVQSRIAKKLQRLFPWIWGSLFLSSALTLSYLLLVVIQPPVWYDPRYLIPLAAVIVSHGMDAALVAGERAIAAIRNSPGEIETHLSLGATPQQAVSRYRKEAIRASLLPFLQRMTVVGMATMPGMMAGQILGGADPLAAAMYQIAILLAIAFSNLLVVLIATRGIVSVFFNDCAQLRVN